MRLEELNGLDAAALEEALRSCCGSSAWVEGMKAFFPVGSAEELFDTAAKVWRTCGEEDWKEAFGQHPKIGGRAGAGSWRAAEQAGVRGAAEEVLEALAEGNRAYETRFGYIFIVCATGKSAAEMLELLQKRMGNESSAELLIAMGEQEKITRLRLEKLLS